MFGVLGRSGYIFEGCGFVFVGRRVWGDFFLEFGVCRRSGFGRKSIRRCVFSFLFWFGF